MTDHRCRMCGYSPIACECPIELTSLVPQLPEGYRTDGDIGLIGLIAPDGQTIARIRKEDGRLLLGRAMLGGSMAPYHFPALAAFLQGAR